jgi:hypothetical protein
MNFDTLITIGVILYIIFSIRKAMSHGKKAPGDTPSTGLKAKLRDMAEQIKQEIEKANQQMQAEVPAPPPLPAGHQSIEVYDDEEDEDEEEEDRLWNASQEEDVALEDTPPRVLRQSVLYDTTPIPSASRFEHEEQDEEDHRNKRRSVVLPPPRPSVCRRRRAAVIKARGKRQLRQAVIWSEILAKPTALK